MAIAGIYDNDVKDIAISYQVNPMGGLSCAVPIEVYPGRDGFTPTIALAYNSHSQNNIAGLGWDISGISAITRTPNNYYYEGKVSPVSYSDDTYLLDGVRLLRIGSYYQTEYGNIIVKKIGNWFKVYYPDGSVAEHLFNAERTVFRSREWKTFRVALLTIPIIMKTAYIIQKVLNMERDWKVQETEHR